MSGDADQNHHEIIYFIHYRYLIFKIHSTTSATTYVLPVPLCTPDLIENGWEIIKITVN